ncbi:MAG: hypothetical protein IV100_11915, partial [Myxococcales bacterium]|nr:hypothetical protein [Myxococcales bacterium]
SANDDFFELGGDSLLAMRLVASLRSNAWAVSVADLFAQRTFGAVLSLRQSTELVSRPAAAVSSSLPLSPMQSWFLRDVAFGADFNHFCQFGMVAVDYPLDVAAVRGALLALADAAPVFRCAFSCRGGLWTQTVCDVVAVGDVVVVAVSGDLPLMCAAAMRRVCSTLSATDGRLLGAVVVMSERPFVIVVAHHLAVDVVSWNFVTPFVRETLSSGRGRLPSLCDNFSQWTNDVTLAVHRGDFDRHTSFWTRMLGYGVPWANASESTLGHDAVRLDLCRDFGRLASRHRLLAVLCAVLRATAVINGSLSSGVMVESHGRDGSALDGSVVGWLTALFPIGVGDVTMAPSLLSSVATSLEYANSCARSYGALRHLGRAPALSARDEPGVTLNFLGSVASGMSVDFWLSLIAASVDLHSPRLARTVTLNVAVFNGELVIHIVTGVAMLPLAKQLLSNIRLDDVCALLCDEPAATFPLTGMQLGLAFESAVRDAGVYVVQLIWSFRASGRVDVDLLRRAWRNVAERHDALRLMFDVAPSGDWCQYDAGFFDVVTERVGDFLSIATAERALIRVESRAPLIRVTVAHGAVEDGIILTAHHCVLDGWSTSRLVTEIASFYLCRSRASSSSSFLAFVPELRSREQSERGDLYWASLTRSFASVPLPLTPSSSSSQFSARSSMRTDSLRADGTTIGAFAAWHWAQVLAHQCQVGRVMFGLAVSGRDTLDGAFDAIGMFVNTIPVAVVVTERCPTTIRELQVQLARSRLFEHSSLLRIQRSARQRGNLLSSLLAVENFPIDENFQRDVLVQGLTEETGFDIAVNVFNADGFIHLSLKASRSVAPLTAHRFFDSMLARIESGNSSPNERHLTVEWNDTAAGEDEARVEELASRW